MSTPPSPEVTDPAAVPASSGDRLPPGGLRRQVITYLADHPGRGWTPTEIGVALGGRSSGAILNTCEQLVALGHATLTCPKPKTFQATATIRAALATLASPIPTVRPPRSPRPASPKPQPPVPPRVPPARADGGVVRPSGQVYRPRSLGGLPDVEILRTLREANVPVLLYGPPGTGKTSLIEAAHGDLITVAGDGDTTVADLIGEYTQAPGGRYEFVYGPLIEAMVQGRALFIDDATLVSPAVLAVVYPAMDGRGEITVKAHKGETIKAKAGFYVIAGHNPGVHGAILSEALSSRFSVQIEVGSDFKIAESLGVNPKAILVSRNLATKRAAGEIGWAPQLRELLAYQKIADAVSDGFAIANLVGVAPAEDRDVVVQVASQVYGRPIVPLTLGAQITHRR
ncbi:AAA family ATPase [Frankia sp. B2]|uniref:AAA family ATPase n=1 Tax=Frankia sp. B2 TaxID=2541730 RepID=UPI00197AE6CE